MCAGVPWLWLRRKGGGCREWGPWRGVRRPSRSIRSALSSAEARRRWKHSAAPALGRGVTTAAVPLSGQCSPGVLAISSGGMQSCPSPAFHHLDR